MEFRFLGNSGVKVSAISYGNWVTHGSQVEAEQATACVGAALEADITTFDTADVYANGRAETILGDALSSERRESLEILTKVFGATGPGGPNDSGLSRSTSTNDQRIADQVADRLRRPVPGAPLRLLHAAGGDDGGVRRCGAGWEGALYRRQRVDTKAVAGRSRAGPELKISFVSNQPKYNALFRVIEPEVVPTCRELGIGQICLSPIEQGILTGKYKPGQPVPPDSRATDG